MTHLVTASHPITLEGGRSVQPGEKVNAKSSDPHVAALIDSGKLVELPPEKSPEDLTVEEIKDQLLSKGISFSSKANKPELLELLDSTGETPTEENNPDVGVVTNNEQAIPPEKEEAK